MDQNTDPGVSRIPKLIECFDDAYAIISALHEPCVAEGRAGLVGHSVPGLPSGFLGPKSDPISANDQSGCRHLPAQLKVIVFIDCGNTTFDCLSGPFAGVTSPITKPAILLEEWVIQRDFSYSNDYPHESEAVDFKVRLCSEMRALAPWKDLNTGQEIHTKCSCFLDDEPCLTWTEHATDQRRSWTSSLREAGWVSFHVNYRDPAAVSEWLDLLSIPAGHPEYLVLPSEPYSYPDDIWENQRGYIEEFYHQAGMKGLKEEMARRGFVATERQFYTRIKKWGLSKNIRGNDKEIMYRKLLRRKTEEGKETAITFHGRSVDLNKIHRFVRSQGLTPSRLSTAATPTYISVYTPMPASLGQPGTARFPWNRSPHKDFISRLSSRLPSPHEGPACDGLDFLSAPSIWDPDEHTLLVASQACAQLDELPFVREHTYSSSQQIGGHTWPYRAKVQPIFNNSLVIDGPPLSAAKRGMNPHAIAADEAKGRRKKRPPFRV